MKILLHMKELAKKYDVTTYQLYQASQTPIPAIGDSIFTKTYNNLSGSISEYGYGCYIWIAPEDTISHIQSLVERHPDVKTVYSIDWNKSRRTRCSKRGLKYRR